MYLYIIVTECLVIFDIQIRPIICVTKTTNDR